MHPIKVAPRTDMMGIILNHRMNQLSYVSRIWKKKNGKYKIHVWMCRVQVKMARYKLKLKVLCIFFFEQCQINIIKERILISRSNLVWGFFLQIVGFQREKAELDRCCIQMISGFPLHTCFIYYAQKWVWIIEKSGLNFIIWARK